MTVHVSWSTLFLRIVMEEEANKSLGEKFQKLRLYLGFTSGPKFAEEIGVSKQTISAIEAEGRGLTRSRIQIICDKYSIDARYFFGQIESPEEADIKKRGETPAVSTLETLHQEIRDLKHTWKPRSDIDPVVERVIQNNDLYDLVDQVKNWDGTMIRKFRDAAMFYYQGRQDEKTSRNGNLKESRKVEKVG